MRPSRLLRLASPSAHTAQSYFGTSSGALTSSGQHPMDSPAFAFSENWQALGPFQIGTREGIWAADPLEYHGGFRALEYNHDASFPSSLPVNATAVWSHITARLNEPDVALAGAELSVSYPNVDWSFLQQVYGWAALQWQAWARGEITVQSEEVSVLTLDVENILEFWIDDKQYFGGDFYGFATAPLVLHIKPGVHGIDVRLVRDVRAQGGITSNPSIDAKLLLKAADGNVQPNGDVLISDRIVDAGGVLASGLASVTLRNNLLEDISVWDVQPQDSTRNTCEARLVGKAPIKIASGQSRPVPFRVACVPGAPYSGQIDVGFSYLPSSDNTDDQTVFVSGFPKSLRSKHDPQKITYLHPGGMVSYAILRPPSQKALKTCKSREDKLPVLLALHGAGVEADSDQVRQSFDDLPDLCAWLLFPTGVTAWSSDDWHNFGFADIQNAVHAIPTWIEQNSWNGPGVDTERWLVTGHSNGGQGVWYVLTHYPDKVIAAAPLSGYSSIQNYVPYDFWRVTDPARVAVVQAGLSSYRHELLLENAQGIPIFQQHGSLDDNVPAYHSRLIHHLLSEGNGGSEYYELPGKPHYWDGVMTTPHLSEFFKNRLSAESKADEMAGRCSNFTIVTANPADTGSKNGIRILGLVRPGQIGRAEVNFVPDPSTCHIHTSNVRMLKLSADIRECRQVFIDDSSVSLNASNDPAEFVVLRTQNGQWAQSKHKTSGITPEIRHGRQLGPIDAVMRTKGAFQVVYDPSNGSNATSHIALQISRNLCQYFSADTEITRSLEQAVSDRAGNVISVSLGLGIKDPIYKGVHSNHAIKTHPGRISIKDSSGFVHTYRARKEGLAAAFLRPLPDERLELVVWGVDEASLRMAARLVPLVTGTGVPDFVIADAKMLWKGVEGTLAMGFFDENWDASGNSFFS